MRHLTLSAFLLLAPLVMAAQEHISIHQRESAIHSGDTAIHADDGTGAIAGPAVALRRAVAAPLSHRVFGYHPYWAAADDHTHYDYSALTTIGYFSMTVDAATGTYSTLRSWRTTPLISYAHERGVKVVLVVTNFGNAANDSILGDPAKGSALITAIVNEVKNAGGDGVNIDFEQVRGTQRANLVAFMRDLATAMRNVVPGAEVSMAVPAVDWSNAFDLAQLSTICDYLILMGYDYHYSGSSTAGPVAPLGGESYNVTRSVDTYLAAGVPGAKLLLGVPLYGYDWPVVDTSRMATTKGTGKAVTYKVAAPAAEANGKMFDTPTGTAWYRYAVDTVQHQVWYDDSTSLALKYVLAKSRGLGGIGIWALSYEGGRPEIWNGIKQAFAVPLGVAVADGKASALRIYPNPAADYLWVEFPTEVQHSGQIMILDALGQEVWNGTMTEENRIAKIDMRILSAGMYLLVVRKDGRGWSSRFVIAR
jgi:spore germination protein YaaH